MRILSWNINGLRASAKSGFLEWLYDEQPDILCLQETKVGEDELADELRNPKGYHTYFHSASKRKGYSGVSLYSKKEPLKVITNLGVPEFDEEGRVIIAEYEYFSLINGYFPNSAREGRLSYKMRFNDLILSKAEEYRKKGSGVIILGDLNVAHEPIDLANPEKAEGTAGYTEEERSWFDGAMALGYIDSFRHFYPDRQRAYSWWSPITRARDRNEGWRLDYVVVSSNLAPRLKNAFILSNVMSSDHSPVGIELV